MTDDRLELTADRAPFVMVPTWLLYDHNVSDGAVRLYGALHDAVAGREGPTRLITRQELAEACGCSVDTIDRRLAELVAAEAVEKMAQHRAGGQVANRYHVRLNRGRKSAAPPPQRRGNPAAPVRPLVEEQEEQPPNPQQAGGAELAVTESASRPVTERRARRADGTNPRAQGSNPRGPRIPTPDELAADARRQLLEQNRQRETHPCRGCLGDKLTAITADTFGTCPRCAGTGVEPGRPALEVVR